MIFSDNSQDDPPKVETAQESRNLNTKELNSTQNLPANSISQQNQACDATRKMMSRMKKSSQKLNPRKKKRAMISRIQGDVTTKEGQLGEILTSNINSLFSNENQSNESNDNQSKKFNKSNENQSNQLNENQSNETNANDVFVAPVEKVLTPLHRPIESTLNEDQIRFSVSLFARKGKLPDKNERCIVLQYIQKQYIQNAIDREYDKAKEMYKFNLRFLEACHQSDSSDHHSAKTDEIDSQIVNAQIQMQNSNDKWMNKISELRNQQDTKIESTKI